VENEKNSPQRRRGRREEAGGYGCAPSFSDFH
jgi:hypothetical protein